MIHFITFATPKFRVRQLFLDYSARWFGGANKIHSWTKRRLKDDGFIARHPELFSNSKGFGWYSWKPYVILKALNAAEEGDLIIYQDVGRRDPVMISKDLHEWDHYLTDNELTCLAGVLIPAWGPNHQWTKPSVFKTLNLMGNFYENSPQVQASWSIWRKCTASEKFVNEWAKLCQNVELVGGQLSPADDLIPESFVEHRWDQSILTMLALRDSLPTLEAARARAKTNEKSIDSFGITPVATPLLVFFKFLARCYLILETSCKNVKNVSKHSAS